MRTRFLLLIPALAVVGGIAWSVVPRVPAAVTCTSNAGVTRTWTTPPGGRGNPGASSAEAPGPSLSPADKLRYVPVALTPAQELALKQKVFVTDAIAQGFDPVTAARQFGPWTVQGGTAEQIAHASDPATYGWRCH